MKTSVMTAILVCLLSLTAFLCAQDSDGQFPPSEKKLEIKVGQGTVFYYKNHSYSILALTVKNISAEPVPIVVPDASDDSYPLCMTLVGDGKRTISIPLRGDGAFVKLVGSSEIPVLKQPYDIPPGETIQMSVYIHNIFEDPSIEEYTLPEVKDLKAGSYACKLFFMSRESSVLGISNEFTLSVEKDLPADIMDSYKVAMEDLNPRKALEFLASVKDEKVRTLFAYGLFSSIIYSEKIKLLDINPADFEPMIPQHLKPQFALYCYILKKLSKASQDELDKERKAIIEKYPEMKWWLDRTDKGEGPIEVIKKTRDIYDDESEKPGKSS